jgi:hypothetical protein
MFHDQGEIKINMPLQLFSELAEEYRYFFKYTPNSVEKISARRGSLRSTLKGPTLRRQDRRSPISPLKSYVRLDDSLSRPSVAPCSLHVTSLVIWILAPLRTASRQFIVDRAVLKVEGPYSFSMYPLCLMPRICLDSRSLISISPRSCRIIISIASICSNTSCM